MDMNFLQHLAEEADKITQSGLFKTERVISSPQRARITCDHKKRLNLCSNNYLGLCEHPTLIQQAKEALDTYGFGMSSVRFICGTQNVHKNLEARLSSFLGMEDTILYSSCFDANTGLFETLLGPEDAIISDELNHASIIDGIRLCKAKRFRYTNNDMSDLETKLQEASSARFRMIATDGVFSMDGTLAKLPTLVELAEKYKAILMVDDSHAVGFMGARGRGTHEHFGVMGKIDILTGTLGKALGGASGGYVSARKEVVQMLRQRSRPYLFSNTLAPVITATSLGALDLLESQGDALHRLRENTRYFRKRMTDIGFHIVQGEHPIIPIMIGDAKQAQGFAEALYEEGIYVVAFSFPVVPHGKARIRTQMSAAHTLQDLESASFAFEKVARQLKIL